MLQAVNPSVNFLGENPDDALGSDSVPAPNGRSEGNLIVIVGMYMHVTRTVNPSINGIVPVQRPENIRPNQLHKSNRIAFAAIFAFPRIQRN